MRINVERRSFECPHCNTTINSACNISLLNEEKINDGGYVMFYRSLLKKLVCPACNKLVLFLVTQSSYSDGSTFNETEERIFPFLNSRSKAPSEVPNKYGDDFNDACKIVDIAPKASAALSRRCLQHLIHGHFNIKGKNLSKEIDTVIEKCGLPSHLTDAIDAIRNIGNFAAHPIKSENTTEIVDVADGEAEWCLDVLEGLFDFCFVQPTKLQEKRDKLNLKLKESGKPALKAGRLQAGDKLVDKD